MVKAPRPICRYCAERVPFGSFAKVLFPSGMTHLMHYCPKCHKRAGSPIKAEVVASFVSTPDTLPVLRAEAVPGTTKPLRKMEELGSNAPQHTTYQLHNMPYQEYLQTAHWKLLAEKVKRRAKWRCQLCNEQGTMHVHHRTYERRGFEYLKDLICLCSTCHYKFHNKRRA